MKKILATLLILLVSFSLLANGSKESVETAPEKVTLTLACRGSEVDIKTYEDRAALVNAKFPDIELKVMSLPNDDYDAKIQTMLASGTAPDIIQVAESSNSYASKGLFTNLSPMAADAGIDLDARFGGATEAYIWKGNL